FTVGSDFADKVWVKVAGKVEAKGEVVKAAPKKGDNCNGLAFFIKYYLLMCASGNVMDPVFVVQDKFMAEGAFSKYWVPAFYRWLFRDYFATAVLKLRGAYSLADETPAWFQLDGEPLQIKCFEEPSMVDRFCELCVVCGKPPASTTECTQACDCGNCFKGSKTALKYIKDMDIDEDLNAHKIAYLRDQVFAVHMAETVKQSTVQESWRKTGIYPFSLDTILSSCKEKVSLQERDVIRTGLPELARRIMERGELLGADLRAALGPDIYLPHLFSRDLLVMYRRRSVILTHQAILAGLWQKVRSAVEKVAAAQQKKADAVEEKATKKRKKEAGENAVLLITRKKPLSSSSSSSSSNA
ncbi:hypothetical protein B484DRAFT_408168, partial [Ochromonadaceae sp. CCMP2298]